MSFGKKDLIFFGLVLLCCFGVVYLIAYMKGEGGQCLKNPYIYGASKMKDVSCYCSQEKGICDAKFSFNDTSFDNPPNVCDETARHYDPINFSLINLTAE